MRGNSHVRFLGGKRGASPLTYPTPAERLTYVYDSDILK
jgi:hypothetical protein